ncbi:hypothetical protein [Streptomyces sp. NPDC000878]
MTRTGWIEAAPCKGIAGFVHRPSTATADTAEDDARQRVDHSRSQLDVCRRCPFRQECVEAVAPGQSGFDGVCGGRVWRDGQVLATAFDHRKSGPDNTELAERAESRYRCGTDDGYRQHLRAGEKPCRACTPAYELTAPARRAKYLASRAAT